jgi:hypothetical protein
MAIGITGFLLVLIHVLMSVLLFSPAIYGKFFDSNITLTLTAGLSMFAGIVAFVDSRPAACRMENVPRPRAPRQPMI